jgi:hypothetical protein
MYVAAQEMAIIYCTGWQRYFQNIFKALLTHENVAFSESFALPNLASCL